MPIRHRLRRVVSSWLLDDPRHAAKFHALSAERTTFVVARSVPPAGTDGRRDDLPIPPSSLWLGYATSEAAYLASGQRRATCLRRLLHDSGFRLAPTHRFLDFGCASGIVLRWFPDLTEHGEAWGVDIAAKPILWCQQHLSPPFRFVTTTTLPHLPFDDRTFDVVLAGSVFTHVADLTDAWLLELRRVTRPGGRLVATIHDEYYLAAVLSGETPRDRRLARRIRQLDRSTGFLARGWASFTIDRRPGHGAPGEAQVFTHLDWVRRHWAAYWRIVDIVPGGLGGRQTAVVLERG